jgi:hypothetical protein
MEVSMDNRIMGGMCIYDAAPDSGRHRLGVRITGVRPNATRLAWLGFGAFGVKLTSTSPHAPANLSKMTPSGRRAGAQHLCDIDLRVALTP